MKIRPIKIVPGIWVVIIICAAIPGLIAGFLWGLAYDLPEINQLKQFRPMEVSTIFDVNGQVMDRFFIEKRFPVSFEAISPLLIQAVITTEDRAFYSHVGINPKAVFRAIIQDLLHGHFKQGGSTLTQQLAKTLFLSPKKSIVRKIREAILALQIERRYTKKEILTLYLNQIYLGAGSYGVEAASRTYFHTSAQNLSLGQAALIAGLPKAPSRYSPLKNKKLARIRRDTVLKQMRNTNAITPEDYEKALAEPVVPEDNSHQHSERNKAPFFTAHIRQLLETDASLLSAAHSQGIQIHTTLDLALNQTAQTSLVRHLTMLEKRMKSRGKHLSSPEGAVVGLDVATCAIRVLVGGKNFSRSPFNRAIQARRQPGSAFKPFVYATAITKGYSQTHVLEDSPLTLTLENGDSWQVHNFSPSYEGPMTMRRALALSKNTTAARLLQEIGAQPVIDFARKAGISSFLAPYPSLALGSFEVSLMELTRAYVPFANQGIGAVPFAIQKITDRDGHVLFASRPQKTNVLTRQDAAIVTDMLKAVIFEGTGKKAARIQRDIAGKTGTTNACKDAVFVGYSPSLALGVWVGNDDASTLGKYETGGKAALPIWTDIMEQALSSDTSSPGSSGKIQYFDIPDHTKMVYIDDRSGEILEEGQDVSNSHRVKVLVKNAPGRFP